MSNVVWRFKHARGTETGPLSVSITADGSHGVIGENGIAPARSPEAAIDPNGDMKAFDGTTFTDYLSGAARPGIDPDPDPVRLTIRKGGLPISSITFQPILSSPTATELDINALVKAGKALSATPEQLIAFGAGLAALATAKTQAASDRVQAVALLRNLNSTGLLYIGTDDIGIAHMVTPTAQVIMARTYTTPQGQAVTVADLNVDNMVVGLQGPRGNTGATGLQGIKGDTGSVTNHTQPFSTITNTPTTLSGYGITDTYTAGAVQSRGMNLITNGAGLLGTNYNFSSSIFYGTDTYTGKGSFLYGLRDAAPSVDELIPVSPSRYYRVESYLKSIDPQANNYAYIYASPLDISGLEIAPPYYTYSPNTFTTLAQPLKVGDTSIKLVSAAGWSAPAGTYESNLFIKIHKYRNAFGYEWPVKTYSRNVSTYNNFVFAGVNTSTNTIALTKPWDVPNPDDAVGGWPAGTSISVAFSGGSYMYFGNVTNTPIPSNAWTKAGGVIGGSRVNPLTDSPNTFPIGTAFIKIGYLLNRMADTGSAYPSVSNKTAVSGLYMTEITPENITGGNKGYSGTYTAQDGRTVTVVNGIITGVL